MSIFTPEWRLKINSVEYTDLILSNLTITSGRTDIYSQPVAGYVSMTVINLDQSDLGFRVTESVSIELKDSNDVFVPIFGGYISDIELSIAQIGNVGYSQSYQITALGALSKLPKTIFSDALAEDYDGNQIYEILYQTLFKQWQDVPAAETWANYDPTITWATAENSGVGQIDQPGDYLMIARGADPVNSYTLASQIAASALGILYEDSQGLISYADSTHRTTYLATYGYVDLSAAQARAAGLKIRTRAGDVRNYVTIQYGASMASTTTASDADSIYLYGSLAQVFSTYLKNTADAEFQADFYLGLRAYPRAVFDSITYDLTNSQIDDGDRDSLINVFMGMPVNISDLPLNMNSGSFRGFVEGWTLQAAYNEISIQLTVSPLAFSIISMKWIDVLPAETWNSTSPTLDWQNATVVA